MSPSDRLSTVPLQSRPEIAQMESTAALPRRSGELVFHDAWERRAFALAVALCENGHFSWDMFRNHLIHEIDAIGETAAHPRPDAPGYYEHWLRSLEKVLVEQGVCPAETFER